MGIKNLLKSLRDVERRTHVSELKGQRVAIDTYCWLHRAVVTCAVDLATGNQTTRYVQYVVSRVQQLQRYGITVVMVFDGAPVPLKSSTESARASRREENLLRGLDLYRAGDVQQATSHLEKSVNITTEMAYATIQAMQQLGVQCIVAPYEADAQLAYLARMGFVDVIITEDSDLLVYGTPCVWFKLERDGYGVELKYENVVTYLAKEMNQSIVSHNQFKSMCIIAGCDYLPSLPGVGLKKATKLVSLFSNIEEITIHLRNEGKLTFSNAEVEAYCEGFEKALYCFTHHIVYDPSLRCLRNCESLQSNRALEESVVGKMYEAEIAVKICATITLDPCSLEPYKTPARPRQVPLTQFVKVVKQTPPPTTTSLKDVLKRNNERTTSSSQAQGKGDDVVPMNNVNNVVVVSRFFRRATPVEQNDTSKSDVVIIHDTQSQEAHTQGSQQQTQETAALSQSSSGSTSSPLQQQRSIVLKCPHNNDQCTSPHSIFMRCPSSNATLINTTKVITDSAIDVDASSQEGESQSVSIVPTPKRAPLASLLTSLSYGASGSQKKGSLKQTESTGNDEELEEIDEEEQHLSKRIKTSHHHPPVVPVRSVSDISNFLNRFEMKL